MTRSHWAKTAFAHADQPNGEMAAPALAVEAGSGGTDSVNGTGGTNSAEGTDLCKRHRKHAPCGFRGEWADGGNDCGFCTCAGGKQADRW